MTLSSVSCTLADVQQIRSVCDKSGITFTCGKSRVIQYIEHETRIFVLTPLMLGLTAVRGSPCVWYLQSSLLYACHFQKQGIVERRDRRALEAVAAVQSDAETARRTVGFDCSCIRHEVIRRILGRDTALDRVPGHLDRVLAWNANFLRRQRVSFRDQESETARYRYRLPFR